MAQIRTVTEKTEEVPEESGNAPETPIPDEITRIQNMLGGDNSADVYLYKRNPKSKERYELLTKYTANEFDLLLVKEEYGGGDYKIVVHGKGKSGNVRGTEYFSIAETKRTREREDEDYAPRYHRAEPEPRETAMEQILPLIREMQNETRNMMLELVRGFNAAPRNTGDSEERFLEKMIKYKELFGNSGQNVQPVGQMLDMFTRGLEMAKEIGGGGETTGTDILKTAIEKLAPVAMEAFKLEKQNRIVHTPVPQIPESVPVMQNPVMQNPVMQNTIPSQEPVLEENLKNLLMLYNSGISSQTVAELVWSKMEDEDSELPILLNPEFPVKIKERVPGFDLGWLKEVQEEIRLISQEPFEDSNEQSDMEISDGPGRTSGNDKSPGNDVPDRREFKIVT
jgi:hypothetical protein